MMTNHSKAKISKCHTWIFSDLCNKIVKVNIIHKITPFPLPTHFTRNLYRLSSYLSHKFTYNIRKPVVAFDNVPLCSRMDVGLLFTLLVLIFKKWKKPTQLGRKLRAVLLLIISQGKVRHSVSGSIGYDLSLYSNIDFAQNQSNRLSIFSI